MDNPETTRPETRVLEYARTRNRSWKIRAITGVVGLLAATACGWQVWRMAMWAFWGAPTSPLHPIAMLGAAGMLVSCIALLKTGSRAAVIGILATTVPLWIFYGPATVITISEVIGGSDEFDAITFIPPVLLLCTTVLASVAVRRSHGG